MAIFNKKYHEIKEIIKIFKEMFFFKKIKYFDKISDDLFNLNYNY